MIKRCSNCANSLRNCKENEKDPSRCELFCQGGSYEGFIPFDKKDLKANED